MEKDLGFEGLIDEKLISQIVEKKVSSAVDKGMSKAKKNIGEKQISVSDNIKFDTSGALTSEQKKQVEQAGKKAGENAAKAYQKAYEEEIARMKKEHSNISSDLFIVQDNKNVFRKKSKSKMRDTLRSQYDGAIDGNNGADKRFVERYVTVKNAFKEEDFDKKFYKGEWDEMTQVFNDLIKNNKELAILAEEVNLVYKEQTEWIERQKELRKQLAKPISSTPPVQANQNPVLLGDQSSVLSGNQTPLSSPTPDKTAESVEEKAKEIDAANEQIESSNEEVEQSEKEVAQATEEGRKKASDSAKKHADEVKKVKDEIVQANKEIAQSENNPLNTNTSSEGMKAEASAADKVADSMKKAAQAKDKFADSNKKVKASTDTSTPGLKSEADAVEEISDIEPMSDEWNDTIKASKEYLSILGEVYNVTRKIRTDKDGNRLISYQLTGETGNSITIGKNRSLISSTERVDSSLDEQNYKSRLTALQQATEYEERENEYIKERNKLLAEGKKQEEDFYKATKQNNTAVDAYEKLYKSAKEYYALLGKQKSGVKLTKDEDKELTRLTKEFYEATEAIGKYAKAQDELGSIESKNRYDNTKSNFANDSMQSYLDSLQNSINEYNKFYNTIAANKRGLTPVVAFQENIDKLEGSIKNLQTLKEQGLDIIDANDLSMAESLRINIEKLQGQLRLMKNNKEYQVLDSTEANKKIEDIYQTLAKNTRMPKELKELFEALRQKYQLAIDTGASQKELEAINVELSELKVRLQESGKTGKSFFDLIGTKSHHLAAQFFAMYFSLQDLMRLFRQGYQYVAEIDKQMIELEKVSDMSGSRLTQSFEHATEAAKDLGATISDVISATADWSRLGYGADAAEELAEVAILYKNVGDGIDISTANESLISTLQGFQMEASQAMDIVDSFNEVANRMPIDSAGIGEALKRSAASFNAANTSLSESISLITATNAVIQDPTSVGTMWKTVSARIRGAKAELEEMGEDTDGMVESTSKLRDLIKGMTGFDIMEDEDTFKSIYDIMIGIGEEWENLSDIDQSALLEAMAGKRAGNALAAALQNVDMMKEAYAIAENSAGSAMREQEKWEQGLEARTNKLKASLEELSTTVLDSDFLGGAIDAGRTFIEVLTEIIDTLGVIPTLLGGIGAGIGIKSAISGNGRHGKASSVSMNMPLAMSPIMDT